MNVLFLSLVPIHDIDQSGIYSDLLREFHKNKHHVCIVFPSERRHKQHTVLRSDNGVDYLSVWTLNSTKCNFIEKGISTILIEYQFKRAIKKHLCKVRFDLILYATPPITFANVVRYLKKRDSAFTYLLLKDIFPQNAVDLNLLKNNSLLHKFFKYKEKRLYEISDMIGCMSDGNVKYLLENNPELLPNKVEVSPNSMTIQTLSIQPRPNKSDIFAKYDIPIDKKVCIYGGNLGKPQSIPFLIECFRREAKNKDYFFVVVGAGTEYHLLENYTANEKPNNVKILTHLPKCEFDILVKCCDVGMIFLDHRFTIPNYPSRLLSYLSAGIPILAATDKSTDIGAFIERNEIGVWCESDSVEKFHDALYRIADLKITKDHIHKVLYDNFNVADSYKGIIKHLNEISCQ